MPEVPETEDVIDALSDYKTGDVRNIARELDEVLQRIRSVDTVKADSDDLGISNTGRSPKMMVLNLMENSEIIESDRNSGGTKTGWYRAEWDSGWKEIEESYWDEVGDTMHKAIGEYLSSEIYT